LKEKSSSEKALDYMQGIYDRKPDYFQNKSNRKTARQGFINTYNLDLKKGSDIFNHAFPKFLRKNRLKREDFLETRLLRPKNSDMNATIKPKPQSFAFEKSAVDIVNEEFQQQQVGGQSQIKNEHIEPEAVESAFEGLWTLLKIKWPLEKLTKEERESLGRIWLPLFRKHLSENWAYIGLPILAAIGIFGKHIIKARRIKKEKESKEKQEKEQSKTNHSKSESSNL